MAALETPWLMSMSPAAAQAAAPAGAPFGSPTTALSSSPTYATFVAPGSSHIHQTSPLLTQTPPTVTRALSLAYPYIVAADRAAALLTWTSSDIWASFLVVAAWSGIVLHWETLVRYCGHLLAVGGVAAYVYFHSAVDKEQREHPTLDAIVHSLTTLTTRLDLFFSPVTTLSLTTRDLTRLLFTTLFLSPLYVILTFYVLTPRIILLLAGVFVLTYHSLPARVTRTILWRSRSARLVTFYLTGLDFSRRRRSRSMGPSVPSTARPTRSSSHSSGEIATAPQSYSASLVGDVAQSISQRPYNARVQNEHSDAVRFTYVVYENQRKWLGIGWTSNLLAYERTAWTDEFLNDCPSPDEFTLPDAEGTGMRWKWVDNQWRLDETNGDEEGWLYYDNTWKKPSKEDAFGKYTRRRRWVRNAELVEDEELLATETEVFDHVPVEGDSEDYKPEIERKVEENSATSVDLHVANDKAISANASHSVATTGPNAGSSSAHDTWQELKKRTMLRHAKKESAGDASVSSEAANEKDNST
ncbi:integral peroxisomal membrane peroxin-domain-containing protein [Lipomyces orientalis]|uniref:Integral peroxisomal membrane peroxin-domain-containing protein n=1 Tax=Lipomyces orientalis TaxID=1233043 RepID=A0ACC3TPJ2_9ASCO